jgi:sulfur carrier protein
VITIIINGEPREFDAVMSVSQLLERLELIGKKIALERNGEIVPRSQFSEQRLADGDRIEIVVAVGGG